MSDTVKPPTPNDERIGELTPGIQRKEETVVFRSGNPLQVQRKNEEIFYRSQQK